MLEKNGVKKVSNHKIELIASCIGNDLNKWGLNEEQKLDVLNIAIVEVVSDIMDKVDVLSEATLQRAKNLMN